MTDTICQCEIPSLPKNASGVVKGNVCQNCQGKVPEPGTDPRREIASLLIEVQGTMGALDFTDDQECAEFVAYLRRTLREGWRQKLLGWRNNRRCAKMQG